MRDENKRRARARCGRACSVQQFRRDREQTRTLAVFRPINQNAPYL
jgi:hypothetical protein